MPKGRVDKLEGKYVRVRELTDEDRQQILSPERL